MAGGKGNSPEIPRRHGLTCPVCGAEAAPDDWFCLSCGHVFTHDEKAGAAPGSAAHAGSPDAPARPAPAQEAPEPKATDPDDVLDAPAGHGPADPDDSSPSASSIRAASALLSRVPSPAEPRGRRGGGRVGRPAAPRQSAAPASRHMPRPTVPSAGHARASQPGHASHLRGSAGSAHYAPEPAPSAAPRVIGALAALALAVGIGWWAAGKDSLPRLPFAGLPSAAGSAAAAGSDVPVTKDPQAGEGEQGNQAGAGTQPDAATPNVTPEAGTDDQGNATETVNTRTQKTYTLVHQALTWDQAAQYCQEHGGQLAQPKTTEELQTLIALVRASDSYAVWLGGTRNGDAFTWLDGTAVDASAFAPGEPNNDGGNEDCLALLQNHAGCALYDVPNTFSYHYPADFLGFVMEK